MARGPRRKAQRPGVTLSFAIAVSFFAAVALSTPVLAGDPVRGPELRAELSGNTLSGYNTSGVVFSEYHAPDGRIFGHNNGEPVVEGCWDIKDDGVCYYYARSRRSGTYCWRYRRLSAQGYALESFDTMVTGTARLDPGNPHGHTGGSETWTCEGLVSGLDGRLRSLARLGAGAHPRPPVTSRF